MEKLAGEREVSLFLDYHLRKTTYTGADRQAEQLQQTNVELYFCLITRRPSQMNEFDLFFPENRRPRSSILTATSTVVSRA